MSGSVTQQPHLLGLRQAARAVACGEVSPVELVEAAARRIDSLDPDCHAFIEVHHEDALQRARTAERRLAIHAPLGCLHGVPVAIKDLFDTKRGWRNTRGSCAYSNTVAEKDSLSVRRLEAAGAIVIGTTNTPELGHKCITDNLLVGPTSTPFAHHVNAGGSSGGSAAAVAAGMVAAATGSDGAGSLRVPASFCGVFTLKPTFGRMPSVSRPNGFRAAWPPAQTGVLTRQVADAATLLDLLSRPERFDPLGHPPVAGSFTCAAAPVELRNLRVGYSADWGGFPIDSEIQSALAPMLVELERMGAQVEPVEQLHRAAIPDLCAAVRRAVGLALADLLGICEADELATWNVEPDVSELIAHTLRLRAIELRHDDHLRTALYDGVATSLSRYDVLVGPAVGSAGVINCVGGRTVGPSEIEGRDVDPLLGWCPAFIFNFTGHPAACIPAGTTAGGVPVGLQLVADRHADRLLIQIAATIEQHQPWNAIYEQL